MKLLIVRLSAMGDVIHGFPLAANAAAAGHEVAWLADTRYAGLLEGAPFLRRLFLLNTRRGGPPRRVRLLALRRELRAWAPDVTIDVQGLWKSSVAARLSGAPVVGFSWSARREPASVFLCDRGVAPRAAARHVVERNLALLEAAGIPVRSRAPDAAFLLARGSAAADEFLATLREPFALYHPGTARPEKAWGEERFAALARALASGGGLRPAISWGPGDEARVERLRALLPDAALLPPLDYPGLARVIHASALFVAGDTGPLHLADALGARTLGLYGPTDPARNGPYRSPGNAVRYNPSTPVEVVADRALRLLGTSR